MDYSQASSQTQEQAKSTWREAATHNTTAVLDALSPKCTPFAARWDQAADRRAVQRTEENLKKLLKAQREHNSARSQAASARAQRRAARAQSKNPLSTARRAAATADKAASKQRSAAKTHLVEARRNYPQTLTTLAAKAHALHAFPATVATWCLSTAADWATWPALTSAGLIGLNWAAVKLGRRAVTVRLDGDDLSAEERQLMKRLDPAHWAEHADERGLSGTITTPPQLTPAGVVAGVRLDGKWTLSDLRAKAESVRALLGMSTDTRMEIGKGSQGDWARLTIRTRSASDGVSMTWTPQHEGIGMDEVTGELVDLPLAPGVHILFAGITGMGKSVSWRGLFLRAVRDEGWAPIVIDPKRQEAIGVKHAVRAVGHEPNRDERLANIYAIVQELTQEMHRRQGIATGATWEPDGKPENRLLLVVVDEGAVLVRMARQRAYADVLDLLEELWSEARAIGFQFVWATQNPTKSAGVPALVKDNMSAFLSLTTNAGEQERSIFGENAQQEGWMPSKLDGIPGRAMLRYRKRGPSPLRMWFVPNDEMAALPPAEPWRSPQQDTAPAATRPALQLVKQVPDQVSSAQPETQSADVGTNREKVQAAVTDGAANPKAVADATGLNKGTVSRELKALVEAGALVRHEDGTLNAGEVSA